MFESLKIFGTGIRLWAWEVGFPGDPTSLPRNDIITHNVSVPHTMLLCVCLLHGMEASSSHLLDE